MIWTGCGRSDMGRVRQTNEDSYVSVEELCLFVVADGMGGRAAGEVASQLAVEAIENFIRRSHHTSDVSWPYGIEPTLSVDANRLRTAVCLANRRIHRMSEQYDDYMGMGTTVVCALVSGNQLIAANVGDSRLYVYEGGELTQLSQDDSWAATVLRAGLATRKPPPTLQNVLTNVLGARADTEVHVFERTLKGDEILLLCTDGLSGSVSDDKIKQLMTADPPMPDLAGALIQAALDGGSCDNITALVVRSAEN